MTTTQQVVVAVFTERSLAEQVTVEKQPVVREEVSMGKRQGDVDVEDSDAEDVSR